jgi:ethanolamine ammonia-lyase small subunit
MSGLITPGPASPWDRLRTYTPARIALGRAGYALPTAHVLALELAHAAARDAVHAELDGAALAARAQAELGLTALIAASQCPGRAAYLRRPDLGRRLDPAVRAALAAVPGRPFDVAFVLADGLSALAVERHALPMLRETLPLLPGWSIAPLVIATQARVAVGDEIGQALQAETVAVLIGERPGLSAPDSLGVYLTYGPRPGRTDAERHCISNIRPDGLSFPAAASLLAHLLRDARRLKLTGVSRLTEAADLTSRRI